MPGVKHTVSPGFSVLEIVADWKNFVLSTFIKKQV